MSDPDLFDGSDGTPRLIERPRPAPPHHMQTAEYEVAAVAERAPQEIEHRKVERVVPRALEDAWARHDSQPQGSVVPGSIAESQALDAINAARATQLERDAKRNRRAGRIVIQRIEGGNVVNYVSPGRGGGLVRVIS